MEIYVCMHVVEFAKNNARKKLNHVGIDRAMFG